MSLPEASATRYLWGKEAAKLAAVLPSNWLTEAVLRPARYFFGRTHTPMSINSWHGARGSSDAVSFKEGNGTFRIFGRSLSSNRSGCFRGDGASNTFTKP